MRFFKLLWVFMRVGAMSELAYPANFFAHLVESALEFGTAIAGLALVFSHTETLGGLPRVLTREPLVGGSKGACPLGRSPLRSIGREGGQGGRVSRRPLEGNAERAPQVDRSGRFPDNFILTAPRGKEAS